MSMFISGSGDFRVTGTRTYGSGSVGVGHMIKAWVYKGGISDNSATTVFTVNNIDGGGLADAGYYACKFKGIILHSLASVGAGHGAGRYYEGVFAKLVNDGGSSRSVSGVTEIRDALNLAIDSGTTDIVNVTMTVVDTSAYVSTVQFTVDVSGAGATSSSVEGEVTLMYRTFDASPTIVSAG